MTSKWKKNITGIPQGLFRTIEGNADELIAVGKCVKAGFHCSLLSTTNGRYDAVIDAGKGKLLRVQIKGTSTGTLNFTGGGRSGQQISREVKQRTYKYSSDDCDILMGINSNNGDCYIIPIIDIQKFGSTKSLGKLLEYKENWKLLKQIAGI